MDELFAKLESVLIRDKERLHDYLRRYPGIGDLIEKAVKLVKARFPRSNLELGVYQDPEIDDEYVILCIRQEYYDEGFMQRIEEVEEAIAGQLKESEGWFQLTTDFKKRRGES